MSATDYPWLLHLVSTIVSITVIVYLYLRRKDIIRHTQRISKVYTLVIVITAVLLFLNLFRVVFEKTSIQENNFTNLLDGLADYGNLFGQTLIIIYSLTSKIVIERIPSPGKVLVIGAHPDDIEIAAGASVAKLHDAGYKIVGLVLSHGENGGNPESRMSEAKKGAHFLEIDEVRVFDFQDGQMASQVINIVKAIEEVIDDYNPDLIFTHSRHDLHQDHQVIYECTLRAVRETRTSVLCYESPSVTQDFVPVYFIDACGYVDVKIAAIQQHWDQHKKPYMKSELIRSKLSFRGNQAKVEYAEGFEIVRMVSRI